MELINEIMGTLLAVTFFLIVTTTALANSVTARSFSCSNIERGPGISLKYRQVPELVTKDNQVAITLMS